MVSKTKLELASIGKELRPKLEPRILLEDPEKSYHIPHRVTDRDICDNRLIVWENESGPEVQATSFHAPWSEFRTEWRKRNE